MTGWTETWKAFRQERQLSAKRDEKNKTSVCAVVAFIALYENSYATIRTRALSSDSIYMFQGKTRNQRKNLPTKSQDGMRWISDSIQQ